MVIYKSFDLNRPQHWLWLGLGIGLGLEVAVAWAATAIFCFFYCSQNVLPCRYCAFAYDGSTARAIVLMFLDQG